MKQADPWSFIVLYLTSGLLLFVAFGVSEALHNVIQAFMPDLYMGRVSLVYLPFGVEFILAWLVGWSSLLLTIPTTALYVLFRGFLPVGPDMVLAVTLSCLAAPASIALARYLGIVLDPGQPDGRTWNRLLFVGLFGSVLAQFFRYARDCCGTVTPQEQWQGMVMSVVAHAAGICVVLAILMFWFRWSRRHGAMTQD